MYKIHCAAVVRLTSLRANHQSIKNSNFQTNWLFSFYLGPHWEIGIERVNGWNLPRVLRSNCRNIFNTLVTITIFDILIKDAQLRTLNRIYLAEQNVACVFVSINWLLESIAETQVYLNWVEFKSRMRHHQSRHETVLVHAGSNSACAWTQISAHDPGTKPLVYHCACANHIS